MAKGRRTGTLTHHRFKRVKSALLESFNNQKRYWILGILILAGVITVSLLITFFLPGDAETNYWDRARPEYNKYPSLSVTIAAVPDWIGYGDTELVTKNCLIIYQETSDALANLSKLNPPSDYAHFNSELTSAYTDLKAAANFYIDGESDKALSHAKAAEGHWQAAQSLSHTPYAP